MESFVEHVDRQKLCSIGVDKVERMLYYTNKNRCSLEQANEKRERQTEYSVFWDLHPGRMNSDLMWRDEYADPFLQ